jgi:predicted Zn-dependent protease
MNNQNVELDCSVRFIGICQEDKDSLMEIWEERGLGVRRYYKDKSKYVAVVELDKNRSIELVEQSIHVVSTGEQDIFISFSTDSDSEIFEVPSHIVEVSSKFNLKINISYTVISE